MSHFLLWPFYICTNTKMLMLIASSLKLRKKVEAPHLVFLNSTSAQKLAVNCRNINWRSGKKLLFTASDPIWTRKRTCQNGHARNIPPVRTLPRGGHWDFPFRPFFRSVFCTKKLRFFGFSVCFSLWFLLYFALDFRFSAKIKSGVWISYSIDVWYFSVSRRKFASQPRARLLGFCLLFLIVKEICFSFTINYYFLYGFAVPNIFQRPLPSSIQFSVHRLI